MSSYQPYPTPSQPDAAWNNPRFSPPVSNSATYPVPQGAGYNARFSPPLSTDSTLYPVSPGPNETAYNPGLSPPISPIPPAYPKPEESGFNTRFNPQIPSNSTLCRNSRVPSAYRFSNLQIPKWPKHPEELQLSMVSRLGRVLPDILIGFVALTFVVLGIFIVRMNNQPASKWGGIVIQATKIAPTVWPLVFAAVVGSTVKAIALWKAEQGTTLGTLEQLMGSQTVFSTLKTSYMLHSYGFFTALLLVLWAFNPVGGQASLRAVTLQENFASSDVRLQYQNSDPRETIKYGAFGSASGWSYFGAQVKTVYGTALFSPDAGTQYSNGSSVGTGFEDLIGRLGGPIIAAQSSTSDIWGNVRIPIWHLLPDFDAIQPQQWIDVPSLGIPSYESIIGIPLRGLPQSGVGNITFVVRSNYHTFQCSDWTALVLGDEWSAWMEQNYHTLQYHYNKTLDFWPYGNATSEMFSNGYFGFFLDTTTEGGEGESSRSLYLTSNDNTTQLPAREIIFGSRGSDSSYITRCRISIPYVDARISCVRTELQGRITCAATAMRESTYPHPSSNVTEMDVPVFTRLLGVLPSIFGAQHPGTSTPTEYFIRDPPTAFTNYVTDIVELGDVLIDVFQRRFGLVFNTLWRASVSPELVYGGSFNSSNAEYSSSEPLVNITAEWKYLTEPTYTLSMPWIISYFTATFVLFICAILTIALRFQLQIPEILGYVSTLTRDSRYIDALPYGSTLDGEERARMLKHQWVRIQDVQTDKNVGRIAFSSDQSMAGYNLMRGHAYE